MPTPTVYAAARCPYAHRARAVLTHLGVEHTLRTIDLADKPADFLALSPSGKVPLLQDGDLLLYESDVICTYVAERYGADRGWTGLPADAAGRARHRLGMKRADQVIAPAWMRSLGNPGATSEAALHRELEQLDHTVRDAVPETLLGFHLGPHYVRWTWCRHLSPMADVAESYPNLAAFLAGVAQLPGLVATLPDREATVAHYARQAAG